MDWPVSRSIRRNAQGLVIRPPGSERNRKVVIHPEMSAFPGPQSHPLETSGSAVGVCSRRLVKRRAATGP